MASKKLGLTPADMIFVNEYMKYSNATTAYSKAYPKATYGTCNVEGCRMLSKPSIQEAIKLGKEKLATKLNITKEGMVKELTEVAEQALRDKQYAAYHKMKDMIIKMCGHYDPIKTEISHSMAPEIIKLIEIKKPNEGIGS